MASGVVEYRIERSRLSRAYTDGFLLKQDGSVVADAKRIYHNIFLGQLDSAQDDYNWGRLSFTAVMAKETVLTVRVFATNDRVFNRNDSVESIDGFLLNPDEKLEAKEALYNAGQSGKHVNAQDILLYQHAGRYLSLWISVEGYGESSLSAIRVVNPGDRFLNSFPNIYRHEGDFFHRYLSIFFSLYSDLQAVIDNFDSYIDPDTAPVDLLPIFAGWLGLELDGNFMDEQCLRSYIKLAPELSRTKGTRRAIELAVKLFVDCPTYLVERNLLDRNQLAEQSTLYGDNPYDFTLLISCESDELLRARLSFIINQFKPVRSRANIVFLGDQGGFDAYSYLDTNAYLFQLTGGALGEAGVQTGTIYLE